MTRMFNPSHPGLTLHSYAVMESRLYCVVFVDRGKTRRIISLRKANEREVTKYAEND